MSEKTLVVAHRGGDLGAQENTLEAFEKAIAVGADMIEFDVRRTQDKKLIAFHNEGINGKLISDLAYEEITELLGYGPAFVDDVFDLTRGRIGLDIELKEDGYVEYVLKLIDAHCDPSELIITSFLDSVVAESKRLRPNLRTGLLFGAWRPEKYVRTRASELFPVARAQRCGVDFIAPHFQLARLGALKRGAAAGFPSLVWTVNDDEGISDFLSDSRVAAVITDAPVRALEIRDGLPPMTGTK